MKLPMVWLWLAAHLSFVDRLHRLQQHAAYGCRGPFYARPRGKCNRQVHRGYTFMILARFEWGSVERQRHVPVIRPRAEVIRPGKLAGPRHLIGVEHGHHKPVPVRRVAVRDQLAPLGWRKLSGSKLQPGIDVLYTRRGRQAPFRWLAN